MQFQPAASYVVNQSLRKRFNFHSFSFRNKAFWTIKSNKLSIVKPEPLATALKGHNEVNDQNRLHSSRNGFPLLSIRKSKRPKSWRSNSRKARQLCCWIRLISSSSFSGSRYQVLTSFGLPIIERKKEKNINSSLSLSLSLSANPQINYWEKNRHLKMSR